MSSTIPPPAILKDFKFIDDSRSFRWPDEWFDGQGRMLTPAHLRVDLPATKAGKKAMRMRRQSLKDAADRRGLTVVFNWTPQGLAMKVTGKKDAAQKAEQPATPTVHKAKGTGGKNGKK